MGGDSWIHVVVHRQRPEMWMSVGFMNLCLYRDLNCV